MFNCLLAYKTKKGFLKCRENDKLREAKLRIYPIGLFIVEHIYDYYEAFPQGDADKATVYDIVSDKNSMGYIQFLCIK